VDDGWSDKDIVQKDIRHISSKNQGTLDAIRIRAPWPTIIEE
jgi:hypothetical protein